MSRAFISPSSSRGAGSFQDLLTNLAEAHNHEVNLVHTAYEGKLDKLSEEIDHLHAELRHAGVEVKPKNHVSDCVQTPASRVTINSVDSDAEEHSPVHSVRSMKSVSEDRRSRFAKSRSRSRSEGGYELGKGWLRTMENGECWGDELDPFLSMERMPSKEPAELTDTDNSGPPVGRGPCSTIVIFPNSVFRLNWDIVGLILIGYDLITIPFTQAFQPDPGWASITMDWITLIFWTGDMVQGFFLGYYKEGKYVSNNFYILLHYLRTWFVVDLIVVGPEWMMLILSGEKTSFAGVGKFLKSARAVRILRLLRLAKVQRMINMLYDLIESEWTFIVLNLVKLLVSVMVLNHVVACVWFLIGRLAMEYQMRNWIIVGGVNGTDLAYMYTTSLHWSLTQFTPASMDVSARNVWERAYSIVVLFFAMVVFSSMIGSISGSMTSLRSMKADQMKQFWLLRRYLRQREVPMNLSKRIQRFLEYRSHKRSSNVQADQIVVLNGLSDALQNELQSEMFKKHVLAHHLFIYIDQEMDVVMHRLCRRALSWGSYAVSETIFIGGDEGTNMFFFISGDLEYKRATDHSSLKPPLEPQEWVAEPVLWTSWRHQGRLRCINECETVVVSPDKFMDVMGLHPKPWFFAKHYGELFLLKLNRLQPHDQIDVLREGSIDSNAVIIDVTTKAVKETPRGSVLVTNFPGELCEDTSELDNKHCNGDGATRVEDVDVTIFGRCGEADDAEAPHIGRRERPAALHWEDEDEERQRNQRNLDNRRPGRAGNWRQQVLGFCLCPASLTGSVR